MLDENRAHWTKLVEDFHASGLTQREFSQERGVSYSNLRNWIYRVRREARALGDETETKSHVPKQERPKKALRLIPVEVIASAPYGAATASSAGAVELLLVSGARLRFAAGTDIRYLQALAAAL